MLLRRVDQRPNRRVILTVATLSVTPDVVDLALTFVRLPLWIRLRPLFEELLATLSVIPVIDCICSRDPIIKVLISWDGVPPSVMQRQLTQDPSPVHQ